MPLRQRGLRAHGCLSQGLAWLAGCTRRPVCLQVTWIAASRLYLGLHTPVDILAGAVAGLAVLVCFIAVEGEPCPLQAQHGAAV